MSLHDKYGIIENHLINLDVQANTSILENYFENYLYSDIKILAPSYIDQSIYFNKINIPDLIVNIQSLIKDSLIQRRNNIRSFIKKERFELSDLIKLLKGFIIKIKYIKNIIGVNSLILENSILQLNNIIISDSLILIFIEDQVISFNKEIKELLLFIKKLSLICNNDIYIKMIKLIGGMYKKQIINTDELPIPQNIRRIQKINNAIKYYHQINNNYLFINKEIVELNFPIFKLILENLIEIIQSNSLAEIDYTINKLWSYIINIKKYNFDDLMLTISNEIINRCSNSINNIDDLKIIIKFNKYFSELNKSNNKHNIFIAKISNSIINYFNNETKIINFINEFINDSILNNQISDAITAIIISNIINNLDVFINIFYDLLIKRLTNKMNLTNDTDFKKYIEIEKEIVIQLSNLKRKCNLYKINKVISDTTNSFNENILFNNLSKRLLNKKVSVITTSYNNWNINQTEGIINTKILDQINNTQLGKYLKYYDLFYMEKHDNKRIINWFLHFGEINITYLNQNLLMFPIQFAIVEMFNERDQIPFQEIISSKILINYSDKFKNDIINSIIISGLFIIENDDIILSKASDIKNNLIEIFLNTSEYPNIWEQLKERELAHSREEIVNTVINHLIKTCPKEKSELYSLVKKNIKLFKLEEELFNKSLKYLIEMDYIRLNDNKYEKYF